MALFQNEDHKKKTIWIIIGATILLIIIIRFVFGITNVFRILLFLMQAVLLIGFLFGMGYLFYHLFIKKQKFDPTYINKKKLLDACKKCKLDNLNGFFLSGDRGHSRVRIGTIKGYCRLQVIKKVYEYEEKVDKKSGEKYRVVKTRINERGEPVQVYTAEKMEQDAFRVRPKGFLSMFTEDMIIRISPQMHDELIGDVTAYGLSLIPISEYWYINTDYLAIPETDTAILVEALRSSYHEGLKELHEIVQKAIGLDSRHKKEVENKSLMELPEAQNIGRK